MTSVDSLRGGRIGVSRLGSGSHVMGHVLADQRGWPPFSDTVVLDTLDGLRAGVDSAAADFFLWEHFTAKKHHDARRLRRLGHVDSPWSSWKIVASTRLAPRHGRLDDRLGRLFDALDRGVRHFHEHPDEAVAHMTAALGYAEADAREWLQAVRFAPRTEGVRPDVVAQCVATLTRAGVLVPGKGMRPEDMVVRA